MNHLRLMTHLSTIPMRPDPESVTLPRGSIFWKPEFSLFPALKQSHWKLVRAGVSEPWPGLLGELGTRVLARKTVSGVRSESKDKARNRKSGARPEVRRLEHGVRNGSEQAVQTWGQEMRRARVLLQASAGKPGCKTAVHWNACLEAKFWYSLHANSASV